MIKLKSVFEKKSYCFFLSSTLLGSVIAVRGYEDKSGKFFVVDSSYCGLPYLPCPDIDACVTKEDW